MVLSKKILVISIIFIILLSGFCFADYTIPKLVLNNHSVSSGKIKEFEGRSLIYWSVSRGYDYIFISNTTSAGVNLYLTNSLSVGSYCVKVGLVEPGGTLKINLNDYNSNISYLICPSGNVDTILDRLSVSIVGSAMNSTLSSLITYTGSIQLWNVFKIFVPFIAVVVLVVFGFYLIRRMIIGLSKGKSKV